MTKFEVTKDGAGFGVYIVPPDAQRERFTAESFPTREAAVLWLIAQEHDEYFEVGVGAE